MYTPSYDYLEHHGIEGQKWGKRNGPPYPLDYNDHSAAQKRKNSKGELNNYVNNNPVPKHMTGHKRKDYKAVKAAYKEAQYATAATKELRRLKNKANEKADNSDKKKARAKELSNLEKKSAKEAAKRQKEFEKLGLEFTQLYGSKKIKNLTTESLNEMSERKAKKYVYKHGHDTLVVGLMAGKGMLVTNAIKNSRNKSEFEAYQQELLGNTAAAEDARKKATRKNVALKAYSGYQIGKASYERQKDAEERQKKHREEREKKYGGSR